MPTPSKPVRRGQIWWVDWNPHRGSEQAGRRPSLVVQSNAGNELDSYDLTIIVAISTAAVSATKLHIPIQPSSLNGLSKPGIVKTEQIVTISKGRLDGYIGQLEPRTMGQVDDLLSQVLGLKPGSGPSAE